VDYWELTSLAHTKGEFSLILQMVAIAIGFIPNPSTEDLCNFKEKVRQVLRDYRELPNSCTMCLVEHWSDYRELPN